MNLILVQIESKLAIQSTRLGFGTTKQEVSSELSVLLHP